jgi:hypothetical protein
VCGCCLPPPWFFLIGLHAWSMRVLPATSFYSMFGMPSWNVEMLSTTPLVLHCCPMLVSQSIVGMLPTISFVLHGWCACLQCGDVACHLLGFTWLVCLLVVWGCCLPPPWFYMVGLPACSVGMLPATSLV